MGDAPRTIWAQPTNRHGWRVGQCTDTPVAGTAPYHHDDVVRELREALAGLERLNYSTMSDDEMRREALLGNSEAPFILRARAALAKLDGGE